ncbi:MAG: AEC family transporter [Pseudomonadota bacterium]
MLDLLAVVAPVFLIVGAGYWAVGRGAFPIEGAEALMLFAQRFAIPCLLFLAMSRIDLATLLNWKLIISFYSGTLSCFAISALMAFSFFGRAGPAAVTVGFSATFANAVLLGLPIVERAFGEAALDASFTVIAFHAPICYAVGIAAMEAVLADGKSRSETVWTIVKAIFSNPLMIGIAGGLVVNLFNLALPSLILDPVEFMSRAAIGAALFALGGVLVKYQISDRWGEIGMVTLLRLIWHPTLAYVLAAIIFKLPEDIVRGIVVTASMAPGVNTYVFANMYGRGKGTAASTVLIGTALSVVTVSAWLYILS